MFQKPISFGIDSFNQNYAVENHFALVLWIHVIDAICMWYVNIFATLKFLCAAKKKSMVSMHFWHSITMTIGVEKWLDLKKKNCQFHAWTNFKPFSALCQSISVKKWTERSLIKKDLRLNDSAISNRNSFWKFSEEKSTWLCGSVSSYAETSYSRQCALDI